VSAAVVFGGYGVFGAHVARELARRGVTVTVAGRDRDRAEAFARELGRDHRGIAADVTDRDSCRAALQGHTVAVNCAGPFDRLGPALLDACLDTGCHYVDIADDRGYVAMVRGYDDRFRQRGLTAVYGCSSLPGISGALGLLAVGEEQRTKDKGPGTSPVRARVTLFIGNDNPKGSAAIRSAVGALGRPIRAPQGTVRGFGDPEVVPLPQPFGPRRVYNFDGPEYDLFPDLLGVWSVAVKLGFELRGVTAVFALLARLGSGYGDRTAAALEHLGRLCRGLGSSGAAIRTDVFYPDGSTRHATLLARRDGQRMAALPCALAADSLCRGGANRRGALTVYELLGAAELLRLLTAEGFELSCSVR
jgi:NAD(P)-dependent dehydrogenase (short-subunit alcohol dehydrogenase family)